ncbi:MBL fold metallo-hydrolase [Cohnella faecalis]|uniref:MBL fold metallo-hydrolase n=1 Tax=Cohnella faecalis TaxID=2315694 RepID=UPI001F397C7A|nr:MBL fold metallo-hydrolase [Cohnella faecalis]
MAKIAENIEVLELKRPFGGLLNLTVVHDSDSVVLVDTGLPGQYEDVMGLIRQAGIAADGPSSIILTHQDIDHIGSLPSFLTVYGLPVDVYAHEADKPVIDGNEPFLKVPAERLASILGQLPEEQRRQFEMIFSAASPPNVDRLLSDGETLPFGGGLTVIHTPGHTPVISACTTRRAKR